MLLVIPIGPWATKTLVFGRSSSGIYSVSLNILGFFLPVNILIVNITNLQ